MKVSFLFSVPKTRVVKFKLSRDFNSGFYVREEQRRGRERDEIYNNKKSAVGKRN